MNNSQEKAATVSTDRLIKGREDFIIFEFTKFIYY
jgi:hypothetical protein